MVGVLFDPGRVLVTEGAATALSACGLNVEALLDRHFHGDWGGVVGEARIANERALQFGGELGSSYTLPNRSECLILTGGDRTLTSVLIADELPIVLAATPETRENALRAEAGALSLTELNSLLGSEATSEASG